MCVYMCVRARVFFLWPASSISLFIFFLRPLAVYLSYSNSLRWRVCKTHIVLRVLRVHFFSSSFFFHMLTGEFMIGNDGDKYVCVNV